MKSVWKNAAFLAAILITSLPLSASAQDATVQAQLPQSVASLIPNSGAVTEKLWRGSAPSAVALKELKETGIKTIIDLRKTGFSSRKESRQAQQLGMNYIHLPMGYGTPSESQLKKFMSVVDDPAMQPVYVHCRQGADRTGTLVAIYRMARQRWTLGNAYSEMRHFHFKPWLFPLKRTVQRCQTKEVRDSFGAS